MQNPRRAADTTADEVVDLGSAQRARRVDARPGRLARAVLAPVAFLAVLGLAAGSMVLASGDSGVAHTDPSMVGDLPGTSRNHARPALPAVGSPASSPSPTPSGTPSSPAALPTAPSAPASPSASPSPTPTAEPSATQTAAPTPKPSPSAKPKPKVDYSKLGESAGKRAASKAVNVRKGPGVDFDSITTLSVGDVVAITEREVDGWRQIVHREKSAWVKATYLEKVTAKTSSRTSSRTSSEAEGTSSSSGFSTQRCAKAGNLEGNLTSRTDKVLRAVCGEFPRVSSYGGYRPGSGSYHGSGQAIDVMVSGEYGWQIARWARANAGKLGIIEVIYEQKIWTSQRSGDGWRPMASRGSVSADHYDHVHISVR